ncbi:MAG: PEP-CTERM sorting domain-containing protein [Myxococcota bacterium]
MRISTLGALTAVLGAAFAGNAGAQTVVSSDVVVDTTWSGTVILQQPIFVKDGAQLTIEEGTIVRGQPRTGAVVPGVVAGSPGALIVTNNGTIIANGTDTNPIIMTTAAVDNNLDGVPDDDDANTFLDAWTPGDVFLDANPTTTPLAPLNAAGGANVSLWGGLVVLGNASTNLTNAAGLGLGKKTVEGLTVPGFPVADATYGGDAATGDDADSSGSLSYISVRHAGDEIGNSNELNGVTLAGVGSGTEFHHIEVYCNFDDGIEWFGGTVSGHHLQVVFAGDDQFDLDQGYRGTNQFLVAMLPFFNPVSGVFGSAGGDKGCECDGDDSDVLNGGIPDVNLVGGQPTPFQNMNFYNFTVAGSAQGATFNGHVNDNDGWEVRNGWAGSLSNGIIMDTGTRQALDLAGGGVSPFSTNENAANGLIVATTLSCDDTGVTSATPELDAFNNGVRNIGCLGVNDANFRINQRDTSFTPTGTAGYLPVALTAGTPIDLRPSLPNATMADGIVPALPLEAATYRGAYDAVSVPWTAGWTAFAVSGMQAVPEPGMASLLGAGVIGLMAISRRRR